MHRLMMADGTFRQSKYLRWARTVAYGLIALAGLMLIASEHYTASLFGPGANVMSIFLLAGGIISAVGTFASRWVGEFAGLPLVVSAFIVFALQTLSQGWSSVPLIAVANFSILIGFAVALSARWRVVFAVYRLVNRFSREDK